MTPFSIRRSHYDVNEIDESFGEQWFCSEEEAEEAGFRRLYR
ncbi:sunset domain-containing protein [Neobacillus bataviensis]